MAEKAAPTSAIRTYVVLEQHDDGDGQGAYYDVATEVEARNATNALRAAFRTLAAGEDGATKAATLVVIPKTVWRPTPVRATVRSRVAVTVGTAAA